jgi:hypothetical protein
MFHADALDLLLSMSSYRAYCRDQAVECGRRARLAASPEVERGLVVASASSGSIFTGEPSAAKAPQDEVQVWSSEGARGADFMTRYSAQSGR